MRRTLSLSGLQIETHALRVDQGNPRVNKLLAGEVARNSKALSGKIDSTDSVPSPSAPPAKRTVVLKAMPVNRRCL